MVHSIIYAPGKGGRELRRWLPEKALRTSRSNLSNCQYDMMKGAHTGVEQNRDSRRIIVKPRPSDRLLALSPP